MRDYPLPRTGLRLRSSNSAFRTAVTGLPLGRGILPDREAHPAIQDFLEHRDPVLDAALRLADASGE